jgi:hypothetical protein
MEEQIVSTLPSLARVVGKKYSESLWKWHTMKNTKTLRNSWDSYDIQDLFFALLCEVYLKSETFDDLSSSQRGNRQEALRILVERKIRIWYNSMLQYIN